MVATETLFKLYLHCFYKLSLLIYRFVATLNRLVAPQSNFFGAEVEHGRHAIHRSVPMGLALYGRDQAVESLHEGGRQTSNSEGQDSLQVPFNHSDSWGTSIR